MNKQYRELYYKDMSEEGLKKLEKYGFVREQEEGDIWWQHPATHFALWLDVEYWTDEECTHEPSELVKCNGELNIDEALRHGDLDVEAIETICRLYQDGLVEFRDTTGSSYELMKEKQREERSPVNG